MEVEKGERGHIKHTLPGNLLRTSLISAIKKLALTVLSKHRHEFELSNLVIPYVLYDRSPTYSVSHIIFLSAALGTCDCT